MREDRFCPGRLILVLAAMILGSAAANGCGGGSGFEGPAPPEISLAALETELAGTDPPFLIDVRTPGEYGEGHIEGAVLIPLVTLPRHLADLEPQRHRRIVVACEAGVRSEKAARWLLARGFTDVVNYRGGMRAWRATHGR